MTKLTKNLKFNGGGNFNHTFFWESLAPVKADGGKRPAEGSDLNQMIKNAWGSIDAFISYFNAETLAIQGSGWGWLAYNKASH